MHNTVCCSQYLLATINFLFFSVLAVLLLKVQFVEVPYFGECHTLKRVQCQMVCSKLAYSKLSYFVEAYVAKYRHADSREPH